MTTQGHLENKINSQLLNNHGDSSVVMHEHAWECKCDSEAAINNEHFDNDCAKLNAAVDTAHVSVETSIVFISGSALSLRATVSVSVWLIINVS